MLDVGFSEILLTSAIALIVLGPERLPKVARQVGNWMGRARAMARQLSEQLEREVTADELLKQATKTQSSPAIAGTSSAFDASHTNSIAPPVEPTAGPPQSGSPAQTGPYAGGHDHNYWGADAASTTPQAMHASDPPPAEYKPPHE